MKEVIQLTQRLVDDVKDGKSIVRTGFYTGIGLAISAPVVAIIFRVVDSVIAAILGG